jgi:hypothetical protein
MAEPEGKNKYSVPPDKDDPEFDTYMKAAHEPSDDPGTADGTLASVTAAFNALVTNLKIKGRVKT